MNISTTLDTKRIQALTDAVFAVAMTILILEVRIPPKFRHIELTQYFIYQTFPEILIYILGFITLGVFWIGSHFHHHLITFTDRVSSWLNIFFLMVICMIPFSTGFLNEYRHEKLSVIVYSINLIGASIFNLLMLIYAWKKKYTKPHFTRKHYISAINRLLIPVYLYCGTIIISFIFPDIALYFLVLPVLLHILPEKANRTINIE